MENLLVFYNSLLAIIMIICLGFFLGKWRIINDQASKVFANLLLSVAMPCALFISFPSQFEQQAFNLFLQAVIGGVVVIVAAVIVARVFFMENKKKTP